MSRDGQLRRGFCHPVIPGNKFYAAAAFARMSFLNSLNEEILERREQQGTEPAPIYVGMLQPGRFHYFHEKILREILRVLH